MVPISQIKTGEKYTLDAMPGHVYEAVEDAILELPFGQPEKVWSCEFADNFKGKLVLYELHDKPGARGLIPYFEL